MFKLFGKSETQKPVLTSQLSFKAYFVANDPKFEKFFSSSYFEESMRYLNRKCVEYTLSKK